MICEICEIKEATIKFTQVINKKKKELNICKTCAEDKGFTNPLTGFPKIIGGVILGILGELPGKAKDEHVNLRCRHCQLSWQEFQEKGVLGCGSCYESFTEPISKLLRKMHGSNKHIGNRPIGKRKGGSIDELNRFRNELNMAIKAENYESAAELRDKIRDIEANFEILK
jgi:protein arginine kinase activator